MNDQNLKPFSERNVSEARESGKIGGVKSGEARRRKKTIQESVVAALETINPKTKNMVQDDVATAVVLKALRGDVRAAEYVRDTIGEKPAASVNISTPSGPITLDNVSSLSPEEIRRRRDELMAKAQESEG